MAVAADFEDWFGGRILRWKDSTRDFYEKPVARHIRPFLQCIGPSPLTQGALTQLADDFEARGLAPVTRRNLLLLLRGFCREMNRQKPSEYPSLYFRIPRISRKEIEVPDLREITELAHVLSNDGKRTSLGILLCMYTGLRIGELCALRISDIRLDRRELSITENVRRKVGAGLVFSTPKTSRSIRRVPFPQGITDKLKERCEGIPPLYFLLTGESDPMDPRTLFNHYQRMLARAGLPHFRFHALRHAFATASIEAGAELKALSEELGHSDISITLRVYVHSAWKTKLANAEKLEKFISGANPGERNGPV